MASDGRIAGRKAWAYRPRLSETGQKVRNVIALIWMEDLERDGKTYFNLCDYLDALHIEAVLSPVHDRDHYTPEDVLDWCERHYDKHTGDVDLKYIDDAPYVGKPKKPHVHLGIMMTSQMCAQDFTELMAGCTYIRPTMWEKMQTKKGFFRYCAHLDSPQKARYSAMEIVGFGGVDLSCLLKEDEHERLATVSELYKVINKRKITRFHVLVSFAIGTGDMEFINCVISRASFWNAYFSSIAYQRKEERDKKESS